MRIVISSGHGLYVRGASGIIDEVDEARRVVNEVADWLEQEGHDVEVFHDDVSTTQNENLNRIVDFHNAHTRDVDVSVHFNCYEQTPDPRGVEVLYVTQEQLAWRVCNVIAEAGEFTNRGAKYRNDLFFLNNTEAPAILIEVCFVDSEADVKNYEMFFDRICEALGTMTPSVDEEVAFEGPCSWFGGPDDTGVSPDEGLAFFYSVDDAPHLFLDEQPAGTTGLARRLDPNTPYVACRWDYDVTPKEMLASMETMALVRSKKTGESVLVWPADWGPHKDTGRAADVSPGVMEALDLVTDDEVEVIYPAPKEFGPVKPCRPKPQVMKPEA
jgi:N-acetylmuramoyl-L-alanine amidase